MTQSVIRVGPPQECSNRFVFKPNTGSVNGVSTSQASEAVHLVAAMRLRAGSATTDKLSNERTARRRRAEREARWDADDTTRTRPFRRRHRSRRARRRAAPGIVRRRRTVGRGLLECLRSRLIGAVEMFSQNKELHIQCGLRGNKRNRIIPGLDLLYDRNKPKMHKGRANCQTVPWLRL